MNRFAALHVERFGALHMERFGACQTIDSKMNAKKCTELG